jgi:hypothetical protein
VSSAVWVGSRGWVGGGSAPGWNLGALVVVRLPRSSPALATTIGARLVVETGRFIRVSSAPSARTSSIAGEVGVTRRTGVKVCKDVLADVMQGDRWEKQLTFDEFVIEFTSALGTMAMRVALAWVAVWMHDWSC